MGLKAESVKILRGGMRYISDLNFPHLLKTIVYTSEICKGSFVPPRAENLPEEIRLITACDIPGQNSLLMTKPPAPFLAEGKIQFEGQPLFILASENQALLNKATAQLNLQYTEEIPILRLEPYNESVISESLLFTEGEPEKDLKKSNQLITGDYYTNSVSSLFLEEQSAIALWEKKTLTVFCATQNPFLVRQNVANLLNLEPEKICIVVTESVGDGSTKEVFSTLIAGLAALVSFLTKKPCKLSLPNYLQRLSSLIRYTTGVDANGFLTSTDLQLFLSSGASQQTIPDFFRRAVYPLLGPYSYCSKTINAHALNTNQAPYTNYTTYGSLEAFFAQELHLSRIARACRLDPLSFRLKNLTKIKTKSAKDKNQLKIIQLLLERADGLASFKRKYAAFEALQQTKTSMKNSVAFQLRGIGSALTFYGFDFIDFQTGSHLPEVKLILEKDGCLKILTSVAEYTRGVQHLFCLIAAKCLDLEQEKIIIESLETSRIPDSGPSYESCAVTTIGKLLEKACLQLKKKKSQKKRPLWVSMKETTPLVREAPLFYFQDAQQLSWCVTIIEVCLNPLTFEVDVTDIWCVIEAGIILDKKLALATVERELLNSLNQVSSQDSTFGHKLNRFSKLPNFHIEFYEEFCSSGPLGAKGIGELAGLGVAPAYIAAVSQALGRDINFFPLGPSQLEDLAKEEN